MWEIEKGSNRVAEDRRNSKEPTDTHWKVWWANWRRAAKTVAPVRERGQQPCGEALGDWWTLEMDSLESISRRTQTMKKTPESEIKIEQVGKTKRKEKVWIKVGDGSGARKSQKVVTHFCTLHENCKREICEEKNYPKLLFLLKSQKKLILHKMSTRKVLDLNLTWN